jgi:hypothetical protein
MKQEWKCTYAGCGAVLEVDLEARPLAYNVRYPQGQGPYSERYRQHDCPIARGLLPPHLEKHPHARPVLSKAEGRVK